MTVAHERKLHVLHFKDSTVHKHNPSVVELQRLLNDGWSLVDKVPLAGAGGVAATGHPGDMVTFAEWAALVVLEKGGT